MPENLPGDPAATVPIPLRNPPFGQPNPDAFGRRCGLCHRKATQWKWLCRADNIWIWVCKTHLREKQTHQ